MGRWVSVQGSGCLCGYVAEVGDSMGLGDGGGEAAEVKRGGM